MYSYFVAKGHQLDYLLNLSFVEKIFFKQTMIRELELEAKKWGVDNNK
ncbi:hypothetical protein [[Clostridium] colinum]|nr:hypothetical protein [[Clostridium] colinum]